MLSRAQHRIYAVALCLAASLIACASSSTSDISLSDLSATTAENSPVTVTIPVTASNPEEVVLSAIRGPSHGSIAMRGTSWTYTPAQDFHGTDEVIIHAEDGFRAAYGQANATLTLTVKPALRAQQDSGFTAPGEPIKIAQSALLANDTYPEGDALTFMSVQDGDHGTAMIRGSDVVFTPEIDFTGTASVTYTISDGTGTATAKVLVDCHPSPHARPTAVDDEITVQGADEFEIDAAALLGNDSDPEHNPFTITAAGPAVLTSGRNVAGITVNGTKLKVSPVKGYYGVASFQYTISNGFHLAHAAVALTIKPWAHTGDVHVSMQTLDVFSGRVTPGQRFTYEIWVFGPSAGTPGFPVPYPVDVTISDAIPANLTCTWTCTDFGPFDLSSHCTSSGSGDINDTVHMFGDVRYTLTCQVSQSTTSPSITNTVTVSLTPSSWFTDTDKADNTSSVSLFTH